MFSLLDEIVTRSAKLNGTKPGGDIVTMLLKKRFLSSPFAFGMTLSHYLGTRAARGLGDDDYRPTTPRRMRRLASCYFDDQRVLLRWRFDSVP